MKLRLIKALMLSFAFCFCSKLVRLEAVCNQAWVGDNNGNVTIIDTNTRMQIASINLGADERVMRIAITPDGLQAYVVDPNGGPTGGLFVFNTSTLAFSIIDHQQFYNDVVISPDGKFAYAVNKGSGGPGFISKVDTQTNTVTVLFGTSNNFTPIALVLSPDGTKLYVTGENDTSTTPELWVIDATNGNVLQMVPMTGIGSQLAITPDGQFLYLTDTNTPAVDQINTTTFIVNQVSTGVFLPFISPIGVTIDLNGQFAYVTDPPGTVDVIQISSNSVVAQLTSPFISFPQGIAITPDGSALYVANFEGNQVGVIDTSNFSITGITTTAGNMIAMAMAPLCFNGQVEGRAGSNRDIWQTDLFSQLCWSLPTSVRPKNFLVYRNGKLIATLPGQDTFFEDHYLKPDKTYVYSIYASNVPGIQSLVGTITLRTD